MVDGTVERVLGVVRRRHPMAFGRLPPGAGPIPSTNPGKVLSLSLSLSPEPIEKKKRTTTKTELGNTGGRGESPQGLQGETE